MTTQSGQGGQVRPCVAGRSNASPLHCRASGRPLVRVTSGAERNLNYFTFPEYQKNEGPSGLERDNRSTDTFSCLVPLVLDVVITYRRGWTRLGLIGRVRHQVGHQVEALLLLRQCMTKGDPVSRPRYFCLLTHVTRVVLVVLAVFQVKVRN